MSMTATARTKGRTIMTTFTINDQNEIVAFATAEEAAATTATPFDSFTSPQEWGELAASWPKERLVAIWNSLAGVRPVKRFPNHKVAAGQVWARIQGLGQSAEPKAEPVTKPKAEPKAKRGARGAKGAPAKAKTGQKALTAKNPPQGKKAAKPQDAAVPREGSKTAQVVAMLQRKSGATLTEIMQKMGWQKHTVRGFMAGAMKKAGYAIESFKPEGGERTYRINR
jgi:hypothetical protein